MGDHLDILRQDAFHKRIKGVAGGLHVAWSAKDTARIHNHVMAMPEKMLLRDMATSSRVPVDANPPAARRKFSGQGIEVRDAQPGDLNFLFTVSSEAVDLAGDVVKVDGINCANFLRNPTILNAHDSSTLPIAVSTSPKISGRALTAIAKFPQPGVSESSDQVAAAVRASLVRGASIGFVPLKWNFVQDSNRPFGVDFIEIRLLEWSVCAVPCNPDCLMIGAVQGGKSASRASRNVPVDNVPDVPEEESDWRCNGVHTLPINETDDPFEAAAAKTGLLERCSSNGTISAEAADYFFATDVSTPWAAGSYLFPFCYVTDAGITASKVGWRQSFAALEKSSMPGLLIGEARSLVERLEARLSDAKTAARRLEARVLAAKAKTALASTDAYSPPVTRAQRLAEAYRFRCAAIGGGK